MIYLNLQVKTSLMSCSQTFSELIPSTSIDMHTPKTIIIDIIPPPKPPSLPTGCSMMEFALKNFKLPDKR